MMRLKTTNTARGFSLIEVLIVVGIMAIISVGIAQLVSSQNREARALGEHLGMLELQRIATAALSNSAACTASLTLPTPLTFNSGALSSPVSFNTQPPHSLLNSGTATDILVSPAAAASPVANSLKVSDIQLTGIQPQGAPGSNNWSGTVAVLFDQTKLIRSLRPVSVRIYFSTDPASPPAAKKITSCSSGALVGNAVGAPLADVFDHQGSNQGSDTHITTMDLASYAGATHLHYICETDFRGSNGYSHIEVTAERADNSTIYGLTLCMTHDVGTGETNVDQRSGLIEIPSSAAKFKVFQEHARLSGSNPNTQYNLNHVTFQFYN